jgi:hypothetical protein
MDPLCHIDLSRGTVAGEPRLAPWPEHKCSKVDAHVQCGATASSMRVGALGHGLSPVQVQR